MRKLIVANWKLNPLTLKEAIKLSSSINKTKKNTVVLCPPTIFLSSIKYPNLGAQDAFWEEKGHYTGQTSAAQLKSLKVKYCIVGHSEKRETGESDVQINFKLKTLIKNKITPILCVGFGTTAQEDDLAVVDVLKRQLESDLAGVDASKLVVAYEPVWAISGGDPYLTRKVPTPEHAEKVALFIKSRFNVKQVLYGGSVTMYNAKGYLEQQHLDGLLIGGESLLAKHFNEIINY